MARKSPRLHRKTKKSIGQEDAAPAWGFLKRAGGPGLVIGGYAMTFAALSFWAGVALVYFGLLTCLAEVILDRQLNVSKSYKQITILGIIFAAFDAFTILVVFAPANINAVAYIVGDQAKESIVSGIKWDQRFTDLRVALNNPSLDAYRDLNIVINPNAMTNTASIIGDSNDCVLTREPGAGFAEGMIAKQAANVHTDKVTASNAFGQMSFRDSLGTDFKIIASENGYRLSCSYFPSHDTVQIIFASVSVNKDMIKSVPLPELKPGHWGVSLDVITAKDSDTSDMLGPKPHPSIVKIKGTYEKNKKYRVEMIARVEGP